MELFLGLLYLFGLWIAASLLGLILLLPWIIFAGSTFSAVMLATKWGRIPALIVTLSIPLALLVYRDYMRQDYRNLSEVINQKIEQTPRLGTVNNSPDSILVQGYNIPETVFGTKGCFTKLYGNSGRGDHYFDRERGWQSGELPYRYVELDVNDKSGSTFGDRTKTGRRGPYELWLHEGKTRQLIDVLFIEGDGRSVLPPIVGSWDEPTHLKNRPREIAILKFIHQSTGKCD